MSIRDWVGNRKTKGFYMRVEGVPQMCLLITGDWQTVIKSKTYWDQLIDQRPDEDMADWAQYRVECKTTAELVAAYQEFRERLKLHCHFDFVINQEEISVEIMTGYAEKDNPVCWVNVKRTTSKIEAAAAEAIRILEAAIE
jgi:hypothetical protein